MTKRNTGNNPLFKRVRECEKIALKAGIIEPYEIHTSAEMREEAWEYYLVGRAEWLESMIQDHALKTGGAQ